MFGGLLGGHGGTAETTGRLALAFSHESRVVQGPAGRNFDGHQAHRYPGRMEVSSAAKIQAAFGIAHATANHIRRIGHYANDMAKLREFVRVVAPQVRPSKYEDGVALALDTINDLVDGNGVESLGPVDVREGPPFSYINMGDPYKTTLVYDRERDLLFVGNWGDIAEKHPEWE
jgi:hypothetical protein